jgi:diacylglycerol kinase family enzyme
MDLIVDEVGEVVVNRVRLGTSAVTGRLGAGYRELIGHPLDVARSVVRRAYVRLRIEADGEVVADLDRHLLMAAFGNAIVDGTAELTIAFATGPLERLGVTGLLRRDDQAGSSDVHRLRASQVVVSGEDFAMSVDGELSGPERRRAWRVEQAAYSLIAPAGAQRPGR